MIESEKAFIGDGSDGKIKLDRYYLHGRSGATVLDIGAYSTLMAEGNIYDSKFTGVRAQFGGPVKYTAEVGKMDAAHRAPAPASRRVIGASVIALLGFRLRLGRPRGGAGRAKAVIISPP